MKDRVPWHVKGVRRQARDTAREAARRSGMSVGQWLNNLIAEQAGSGAQPPRPSGDWREAGDGQLAQSINRLDRRLDQLISQGRVPNSHSGPGQYPHHPQPPSPNGRYIPTPNGHHSAPPNGHWSSGIDQAVAEISARQRALDSDPAAPRAALPPVDYGYRSAPPPRPAPYGASPDLSGLEQQLRHITTQIENLNQPGELTDALTGLRKDLAEIGRTLTEAMPRRALEALEIEVRRLAERIDLSREAGVDPSTIANMERGLADVREALRTLTPAESLVGFDDAVRGLTRKLDQMTLQQDPTNLQQLEAAITALRGIVAHVASNDALVGLAEEVRGLSAKVDRVANAAVAPDADAMSARAQSEQPVLNAIERGFAELTSRLVELQSHSLGTGRIGGDDSAVDHLKHDLARTQDSLEAVHGTLDHLVDRLAMIEGGMRDDARIAPPAQLASTRPIPSPQSPAAPALGAGPAPSPAAPTTAAPPSAATIRPPSAAAPPGPKPNAGPPALRERQPIDPNLPPDFPLEPGSGVPGARPQASAAERIAASEAALGPAKPPSANHPGQTNFIAAARRAAQAAGPAAASQAPQGDTGKTEKPAKSLTQRVRALIVGGSAVLVLIASMRIALNVLEPANQVAIEPPAAMLAVEPAAPDNASAADQAVLASRNESVFAPPAGLILPSDRSTASANAPVARGAEADVTGSITSRSLASTQTSSEPRPIMSDKLPLALRQAVTGGDPAAEYEVALRHLEGRGIPQNVEEAARWLERAAKAGLAPAQFRLGGLYEKGQGVRKNLDTARRHYVAAAEKGNAKAMHNLAVMYAEGIDGKPDYKTASLWFRKAAEHGIADSQYNLGILCARGIGIERNLAESYKWFSLAAAQGDRDSAKKRDDVAARLDQGSLMAAKLAVQSFVAEPQPDQAITVKSPAGGWDRPGEGKRPAKKPRPGAPVRVTPS